MSVTYSGAHSITFIESSIDPESSSFSSASIVTFKNTWDHFHAVPASRPSVNSPSTSTKLITVPGSNRRLDLTNLMPGGQIFGPRTGQWDFFIDHDSWGSWYLSKHAIEYYINGKRLCCVLEDDHNTLYVGRFTMADWEDGANYSKVTIGYDLEFDTFNNIFNYSIKAINN